MGTSPTPTRIKVKIVVTGAKGMLGVDLCRVLSRNNEVTGLDLGEMDVTKKEEVMSILPQLEPDIVVHTAAFTDVDRCEQEPEKAFLINGTGTANMVSACEKIGCSLAYLSTDFVFSGGKKGLYMEEDNPEPVNVYGKSKLAGEKEAAKLENFFIIRTAWLYGRGGRNFVTAILEKARSKDILRVVDDQVGSPTYTVDLSEMLARVIEGASFGIYHISNEGTCSRFDFAMEILKAVNIRGVEIIPIKSLELTSPAKRPANSALGDFRLEHEGFGNMRNWKLALAEFLS